MTVNILAVGDISGNAGLKILQKKLRNFIKLKNISFTVVNGENASAMGITPNQAEEIFDSGADVITLGNHAFDRKEIYDYLDDTARIIRPSNYASQTPGQGYTVVDSQFGNVLVINLIGRCDMIFGAENPFFEADKILKSATAKVILVDMHASATSEKLAMCHYLDGRVSAVWGTHTHVQTSDACIFRGGTGCITDLGMTGAEYSVIGIRPEQSISYFLGNPKPRFEAADGPSKMECVIFEIDSETGKCLHVETFRILD